MLYGHAKLKHNIRNLYTRKMVQDVGVMLKDKTQKNQRLNFLKGVV